jgi:hypothetical protein
LGADHPVEAHLLVARIEHQVRIGLLKRPLGEALERRVEPLVDLADGGSREAVTAQLLGDHLDLARRHALHVHLGECRDERLLRALVTLKQLGRELSGAIARHAQLQLADARHQTAGVITGAVAQPTVRTLSGQRAQRLGHVRLQHFLERRLDQRLELIGLFGKDLLDKAQRRGRLLAGGHGGSLLRERVDAAHSTSCHDHLRRSSRRSVLAHKSGHYPRRKSGPFTAAA